MVKKVANILFNPFTNDSRVLKESLSLAEHNYAVEVIAHGDEFLAKEEQKEGIKIVRFCYLNRKVTSSKLEKLKIYLRWIKEVTKYVKDADILHCNDLNALPIGFIVKKFYNKDIKVVYDAHEYETETNGLQGVQKTLVKKLEKFLIKYADEVICVSDAIATEYVKLYGIKKPSLVLNTPLYKEIKKKDLFRKNLNIGKDKTIFLYQGSISRGRGVEIVIESFKAIEDTNAVILFMGYGELEEYVKEIAKKQKNIYFYPAVSPDILLDYTSSADFGISTIEDTCLSYRYCLPNKMFEYMMADIPLIVSNLPEMRRVVEQNRVGVVAKENTPEGLKEAIKEAINLDKEELYQNIRKVKEVYNWQEQERVLLEVYRRMS